MMKVATRLRTKSAVLALAAAVGVLMAGAGPAGAQPAPAGPAAKALTAGAGGGAATRVLPPGSVPASPHAPAATGGARPMSFHGRFNALQMNLCNGGTAGCYTQGMAVGEANAQIGFVEPDQVTVNEVCRNDVLGPLLTSMAEVWPDDYTVAVFGPALVQSGSTYTPYKCSNGDDFGNGVIVHIPPSEYYGYNYSVWLYGNQDTGNEKRTAVCVHVLEAFFGCATHLSAADASVAMNQCKAITASVIPQLQSQEGAAWPAIVGGDFNLKYSPGSTNNVQNCVPSGYTRKGDDGVQHYLVSNAIHFASAYKLGMQYTDHPALIAELDRS